MPEHFDPEVLNAFTRLSDEFEKIYSECVLQNTEEAGEDIVLSPMADDLQLNQTL